MTIPYPVVIFPPELFDASKMYVFEIDTAGQVARNGWIACPGMGAMPALVGPDGAFYFSRVEGVSGVGITLYRSEIVADEAEPTLETMRVVDLELPTHLPSFDANVPPPSVIWLDNQAAMIGYAAYTYYSPGDGTVENRVAYCSTPEGMQSLAENGGAAWQAPIWQAAVEFGDGAFSTFAWGIAT